MVSVLILKVVILKLYDAQPNYFLLVVLLFSDINTIT